ncbi:MAG: bifunctional hydroxymethylpyrimidine kinase/phosphomethylpyrimidine kinase [Proteobacteria bacterium]|nr:MAG: bifunctional hydroxymethylpyrimidine kinase/phosphomethylpyrimidine kinase [Pseudomonadota bacterium]
MKHLPIVWSIAGSDSGGGAGIQADIKAIHGLGCHPCTAITAVTAQNTVGVQKVAALEPADVRAQLESLAADLPPAAIKIGMVPNRAIAEEIRNAIGEFDCPVVLDPVLVSSSGARLCEDPGGEPAWMLAPHADVVCPNLQEAQALLSREIRGSGAIEQAAHDLVERGCRAVIIKGGHGDGALCQDYLHDGSRGLWISNTRLDTRNTHGTGCTQSSALAAAMAQGIARLDDAAVVARMFVNAAIRESSNVGEGPGPVRASGWPEASADLPWVTETAAAANKRPVFPPPGYAPIGLYPCVETADWVARLAELGVTTIQLRNKSLEGDALRAQVKAAVETARRCNVRLFVNDYWKLAIEHGAYGVHLGQEDIGNADIERIAEAGLRLGVSTHCHAEVARAHALRPSYIACGPIWETKVKAMAFPPQGVESLALWRRTLAGYPLVAIGGIDAPRAYEVSRAGADGVALIRAITQADDYRAATRELVKQVERGRLDAG